MGENFENNTSELGETEEFGEKKRIFFTRLALEARENLLMHKEAGLWGKKESKDDWRNVSEHCLVEAARAEVFAEKLGFSEEVKKDLISGAVLHDFYKRGEVERYKKDGMTWNNYETSEQEAEELLKKKGLSERIVRLVNSIGMITLNDMEKILAKQELSEEDKAVLTLHYIDDYTDGSAWVKPAEMGEDGHKVNDLDKRLNSADERYKTLGEEGVASLGLRDASAFQAEKRVGHEIEARLAGLINEKNGINIAPEELPEFIDNEIREKINTVGK